MSLEVEEGILAVNIVSLQQSPHMHNTSSRHPKFTGASRFRGPHLVAIGSPFFWLRRY